MGDDLVISEEACFINTVQALCGTWHDVYITRMLIDGLYMKSKARVSVELSRKFMIGFERLS